MRTEIVYEDDAVLAVYKPAGLATQTASVGRQDVVSELKNYIRQTENRRGKNRQSAPYLGVIHRLDQPVEGLLVFAKNPKAAASLSAQLQKQEEAGFCKHYYAVLYGCPAEKSGELEDYLCKKDGRAEIVECLPDEKEVPDLDAARRDSRAEEVEKTKEKHEDTEAVFKSGNRISDILTKGEILHSMKEQQGVHCNRRKEDRKIIKETNSGKPVNTDARKARLQYCILETLDMPEIAPADIGAESGGVSQIGARMARGGIALADIRLETGRFHQIRAQMAHGGMPLLGDLKYGNEESIEAGRKLNVRNAALCAYRLEFLHPVTGRKMDFHIKPKGEIFSLFSQF